MVSRKLSRNRWVSRSASCEIATTRKEPLEIRSRYGRVNWHTGQPALYSARRAGPPAKSPERVAGSPDTWVNANSGAFAPAASIRSAYNIHLAGPGHFAGTRSFARPHAVKTRAKRRRESGTD